MNKRRIIIQFNKNLCNNKLSLTFVTMHEAEELISGIRSINPNTISFPKFNYSIRNSLLKRHRFGKVGKNLYRVYYWFKFEVGDRNYLGKFRDLLIKLNFETKTIFQRNVDIKDLVGNRSFLREFSTDHIV